MISDHFWGKFGGDGTAEARAPPFHGYAVWGNFYGEIFGESLGGWGIFIKFAVESRDMRLLGRGMPGVGDSE